MKHCHKVEEAVSSILPKIITKDVQLLYSGCGRIVKSVGKYSFAATNTCEIIRGMYSYKYVFSYVHIHFYCIEIWM